MPNASMQANPTCSDDQGSILVSPSGGKAPYTITLSNGVGYSDTQTNVGALERLHLWLLFKLQKQLMQMQQQQH